LPIICANKKKKGFTSYYSVARNGGVLFVNVRKLNNSHCIL